MKGLGLDYISQWFELGSETEHVIGHSSFVGLGSRCYKEHRNLYLLPSRSFSSNQNKFLFWSTLDGCVISALFLNYWSSWFLWLNNSFDYLLQGCWEQVFHKCLFEKIEFKELYTYAYINKNIFTYIWNKTKALMINSKYLVVIENCSSFCCEDAILRTWATVFYRIRIFFLYS